MAQKSPGLAEQLIKTMRTQFPRESQQHDEYISRAGAEIKTLDHAEIVTENGQRVFRYMKAIPTAQVCTNCHGTDLKPEVVAMIDDLYPTDQARGFFPGDIRGAFTLRKVLED